MTIDDDTLGAYLHGELDGDARAELEATLAADGALRDRLERQRALVQRLRAAYEGVVREAPPGRLIDTVHRKRAAGPRVKTARRRGQWYGRPQPWRQWGALAASLLIGVLLGRFAFPGFSSARDGGTAYVRAGDGLATALSRQLASAAPTQPDLPRIGITFRNRSNEYCRTFSVAGRGAQPATAGLACGRGQAWRIDVLAPAPAASGEYRMAGSELPASVLQAVDAVRVGAPLDAQAERTARDGGWVR
jgi:hypothetical protein